MLEELDLKIGEATDARIVDAKATAVTCNAVCKSYITHKCGTC